VVTIQDGTNSLLQAFGCLFSGKAEVELNMQMTGNDIGSTGTCMDIGDLKRGGREVLIACIPLVLG